MSDVFISYASADRDRAQAVAAELQARGLSVWWDRAIPPGRQFDEVIEEALDAARCVALLWTDTSAASHWVKTEGAEALRRGVLVPALLQADVRIPLEFRRVQAANLSQWEPGQASPAFDQFFAAVQDVVRKAPADREPRTRPPRPAAPPPASPVAAPAAAGPKSRRLWWIGGGAVALVVVLASAFHEPDTGVAPLPIGSGQVPVPTAPTVSGAGAIDLPLRWRDYVLAYEGRLRWDGRGTLATVAVRATDSGTGRVLSEGTYNATLLADAPGRMVFSTQVPVPNGDSRTPGAHTHAVNLVFELQSGGGWQFRRNCMAPGRPDMCWE
jgi:hypothetical protein